jgi:recombination protein RecT
MTSTTVSSIAKGEKPVSPVAKFSGFLDKLKPQLALALPKHMNADRMSRLALTAFSTNPDLQKCTPESIAGCIMLAAQLGLEPGVNGHAYLIPYGGKCTFVPGWKGLVDLVSRSGRATVWTGAVFEGDKFDYQLGDAPYCKHTPSDDDTSGQDFTHVYAIGRVAGSQMPVIEVWSRAKVKKHLAQYNKVGNRHYANANENNFQMYGRKVALLQVLKYMPSSIELAVATDIANSTVSGEGYVIEGATNELPDTSSLAGGATTFDVAQAMQRIKDCKDADTLAVIADEISDVLPEGEDKAALLDAYRVRRAELQG